MNRFKKKDGWYTNWAKLIEEDGTEIYALKTNEFDEIEGLVCIKNDIDAQAVCIDWMCAAPHNNLQKSKTQRYIGVGGHLFSIAIKKSIEAGYEGCVYGFAKSQKILRHYVNDFGAEHMSFLHPNQFIISEWAAKRIEEVYTYELSE